MSLTFIFMPPGNTMSPGFWSGLQAPSHFASTVVVEHAQQARSGRRETATAQAFGSQLLEQGRDRNELREDVGAQLIGRCRDGGLAH